MALNRTMVSLLSLCQRAGKLISGEDSVLAYIQSGEAELVIIAEDASENTRYKFLNKTQYYKKNAVVVGNREELSQAIGKFNRTVFAIVDKNFAERIFKELKTMTQE